MVGAKGFRKGIDLYFERHDGQAVCTEDFVSAMADANGVDFSDFETAWYHQAGTPRLLYKGHHDSKQQTFTLELEQVLPDEAGENAIPYTIPIRFALLDGCGGNVDLQLNGKKIDSETILTSSELHGKFVFENVKTKPLPSLMRQFSAPIILESQGDPSETLLRWSMESDDFNRYEAGQDLAHQQIDAILAGENVDARYLQVFRQLLLSPMNHSTKAEVLSLPSLSQTLERSAVFDPGSTDQARRRLKSELFDFCQEELIQLYKRLTRPDDRSITTLDMGRRSLRNTCLQYLSASPNKELAQRQYTEASNMSDRMAALAQLMEAEHDIKQAALLDFADRHQGDSVVMNKWFSLQAGASCPNLLPQLAALENHPAYDRKNPNKIRALLGGLVKNLVAFHAKDGTGYAFLAERIANIDAFNAGVAANLARAFAKYPSLDEHMAKNMELEIKRLLARPKLSRDVYEILSNTLQARSA
jgi:aminopeptidase N